MDLKVFLLISFLCMLKTSEVEAQSFLKDAYKSVKNVVVKGYHHVANIFMKHDSSDDDDFDYDYEETTKEEITKQEEITTTTPTTTPTTTTTTSTTTIEPMIDIRFKEETERSNDEPLSASVNQREAYKENKDTVPDLDNRFLINTPCGAGMRKSGSGCRQIINN